MSTPDAAHNGFQLWHYIPSVPGGIILASVFCLLTVAHGFFLVKKRTYLCVPLLIGGAFEAIGYIFRTIAHYHINATLPYAGQSILILLAPILFAASVYMYLGRIIAAVDGERHSLIPLRWLTKAFVLCDVTCFFVQAAGGGIMSGAKSTSKLHLGEDVILAGLVLQIVVFFAFVGVALTFHGRMRACPTAHARSGRAGVPWQRLLLGLYCVSALITIRNVVRAVEYAMGSDGYFLTHEWTTYAFDGAPMAVVLSICFYWYLGGVGIRECSIGIESADSIGIVNVEAGKEMTSTV